VSLDNGQDLIRDDFGHDDDDDDTNNDNDNDNRPSTFYLHVVDHSMLLRLPSTNR